MWVALLLIIMICYWINEANRKIEETKMQNRLEREKAIFEEWCKKFVNEEREEHIKRKEIKWYNKLLTFNPETKEMSDILNFISDEVLQSHDRRYNYLIGDAIKKGDLFIKLSELGYVPYDFSRGGYFVCTQQCDNQQEIRAVWFNIMRIVDSRLKRYGAGNMMFIPIGNTRNRSRDMFTDAIKVCDLSNNNENDGYYFYNECMYAIDRFGFRVTS